MKKIKYIIIAVFAIFLFSGEVGATTCNYSPVLPIKKQSDNGYFTWDTTGDSNPYIRMIAYSIKMKDSNFDVNDIIIALNNWNNAMHNSGVDGVFTVRDIELKMDTQKNIYNSKIKINRNYNTSGIGFGPWGANPTIKDEEWKYEFTIVNDFIIQDNACPEVISLDFDVSNKVGTGDDSVNLSTYYLSKYNYDFYDILSNIYYPFNKSNMPITLFLKSSVSDDGVETNDIKVNAEGITQNSKQVLSAAACEIKDLSAGMVSDYSDDVKKILDDANTIDENGLPINMRKIYETVYDLNNDDANAVVEAMSNGKTTMYDKHQIYIYGFVKNMKYFKQKDIETVKKLLSDDIETIKNYKKTYGGVAECLASAYGTNEEEAVKKYAQYNPNFELMYIDSMGKLLNLLYEHADEFYGAITETNAADKVKNDCSQAPSSDRDKCQEMQLKLAINSVDCNHLAQSINNPENLNSAELLLKYELDNLCSVKDSSCYKTMCDSAKKNISDKASDIINGKTENQTAVKQIIDDYYKEIIVNTYVDVKDFDCGFFDEDILEYINGALNLIRIAGPVLVILLTGKDAMTMIASSKEDEKNKFLNRLKIRLICLVLLILVPTIIMFLLNLVNINHCESLT